MWGCNEKTYHDFVDLTALLRASILHSFSARMWQASPWPQCAAAWRGVQPSKSVAETSSPHWHNILDRWESRARGVCETVKGKIMRWRHSEEENEEGSSTSYINSEKYQEMITLEPPHSLWLQPHAVGWLQSWGVVHRQVGPQPARSGRLSWCVPPPAA